MDHMVTALAKTFKSPVVDTIQSLPQHQQIIVCSAAKAFRGSKKDRTLAEIQLLADLSLKKMLQLIELVEDNEVSPSRILHDDFDTPASFRDANFFVIKSYSKDNVYKSIKYCVWASTKNGNKKLDAAYREANTKEVACSVFLLFSLNPLSFDL
ncbi:unnamed protein product [Eruca vesicaria subsp. sativa]|uniref:YTH domain-containing family protein n=1 Tax=Eruca vesicaria subsp. sativa TaxID=29727 RepID=A0ABC8KUV7_ERUVS|nr:unnamed protein product [Eruca vesicaria subsp. sativa]